MSSPAGSPPGTPFADRTGYLLGKLGETAVAAADAALAPLGLRVRHLKVLTTVELASGVAVGPPSQQELCARTGLDRTTMVGTVDDLERLGLVERRRSDTDRRRYGVELTAAGARGLRRAEELLDEAEERLLAPLPAADRARLRELVERVLDAR